MAGSGGREHAIVWKLAQSESVDKIFAIPGNPGIAAAAECIPAGDLAPSTILAAAEEFNVDLTIIGPEAPLVEGVVDLFRSSGKRIVGPGRSAARLEGSKVHAKGFFKAHGIPTAAFQTARNAAEAAFILERSEFPIVVKADGLAAGKGVIVACDRAEAEAAAALLGPELVIEEFLAGEEVSFIVLTDGRDVLALEPCQDHKAVFDNDQGPNTGGMGAYCDARILGDTVRKEVLESIIYPAIKATAFTGFLYAGLMITAEGPQLLEFNVRLGDPEAQPILHRMVADFGHVLMACAEGKLGASQLAWRPEPSVCVVLASAGYPGRYQTGKPIRGLEEAQAEGATVFHSGTRQSARGLETAGGRVLGVTASGETLEEAIRAAYAGVDRIRFEGMHYRRDIGRKGLRRYNESSSGT